uniref:Uncharacterized protein n=1 Tax=Cacopsylla melanoneura TaxID=428564 RepID=A0A8D8M4I2_9HEMI
MLTLLCSENMNILYPPSTERQQRTKYKRRDLILAKLAKSGRNSIFVVPQGKQARHAAGSLSDGGISYQQLSPCLPLAIPLQSFGTKPVTSGQQKNNEESHCFSYFHLNHGFPFPIEMCKMFLNSHLKCKMHPKIILGPNREKIRFAILEDQI